VVFRKGDPIVLDNYRGIAVGSALGEVLSLLLHSRLPQWSEAQGAGRLGRQASGMVTAPVIM